MKLLLPVAGKSSRYPGIRPKWLLTMPNGQLMIERSLEGLNLNFIKEVVIIMLKEHTKFITPELLKKIISKYTNKIPVNIFLLDNETPSQPSTISKYLKNSKEDFKFFIKDCDNFFKFEPKPANCVSYVSLDNIELVAAGAKSYITMNNFDEIELIIEKKVISEKFCCGGYGFESSKDFLKIYEEIGGDLNSDLYISHIIQKKLLDGFTFHGYEAFGYEDYGTVTEFKNYIKNVRSIFCDFDGVLVENSSKFASPPWQYNPMVENLNYLSDFLKNSPDSKLIITTSRPSREKENIINFLKRYNIELHSLVTDLPHAGRILVNDFSNSNPFPTAQGINIPRNCDNLKDYFSS